MTRVFFVLAFAASACVQGGLEADAGAAELDRAYFDCQVQPVLTKYCSAFACHGDGGRYYRVYARNRLRLGGTEEDRNAFMRDSERRANYIAARAMVDVDAPEESLLLRKPLEQSAGGYFHGGATEYGQGDVFADRDDRDYAVLESWVLGEVDDPDCVEPGSDR